jgi:hypothetical protein
MIRLFVRHNVADYAAWRQAYDDFEPERGPLGVTGHAVFQSVDNQNDVTVWHDFESVEKAKGFASSQRLRDVMQEAGVSGQPEIWFVRPA